VSSTVGSWHVQRVVPPGLDVEDGEQLRELLLAVSPGVLASS
jgi:hypothetical protein